MLNKIKEVIYINLNQNSPTLRQVLSVNKQKTLKTLK